MANMNLSIDEQLFERASARAAMQGVTLDALLCGFLREYVESQSPCQRATTRILQLAQASRAASEHPRWTRDSLHDR
jgi:hypothetical protein